MPIPLLVAFLVGAASALAAILILVPVRSLAPRSSIVPRLLALAAVAIPATFLALAPDSDDEADAAGSAAFMQRNEPETSGGLKQDADWALIGHAFMGGPPPGSAGAGVAQPAMDRARLSVAELQQATRREPRNVEAWLALAGAQRTARDFAEAVKAYEAVLELSAGSADVWADYADALATANGRSLIGKPAKAIERALAIDPQHLKALWLAASLDLERRDHAGALRRWQALRAALPEGSPDAAIIDANIAEARTLAGQVARAE